MPQLSTTHTYEELRAIIIDILLGREGIAYGASQFTFLVSGVAEVLARREGQQQSSYSPWAGVQPHPEDAELVRDIFWDLFRQGFITLGTGDSNQAWPFFRLSRFGKQALGTQSPFRFHDTGSFLNMVKHEVTE